MHKYFSYLLFTLIFISILPQNSLGQMLTGVYTGDGSASQVIDGLGAQPKTLLVRPADNTEPWISHIDMPAGKVKFTKGDNTAKAFQDNYLTSLDADGFTVASNANVNDLEYYYVAFNDEDVNISMGSFSFEPDAYDAAASYNSSPPETVEFMGDYYVTTAFVNPGQSPSTDPGKWDAITLADNIQSSGNVNIGYEPASVILWGNGLIKDDNVLLAMEGFTTSTYKLANGEFFGGNLVMDGFNANGFSVKTPADNQLIEAGATYYYLAFDGGDANASSAELTGVSSGDEILTNNTDFVMVRGAGSQNTWFRTVDMTGDSSYTFKPENPGEISVIDIQSDRFKVGLNGEVTGNISYFSYKGSTVLPVTLISFKGKQYKDGVQLNWQTGMEINSSHFLVQRSSDGVNYETIGTVYSAGNSSQVLNYRFFDDNPLNGNNYYRLQQLDVDGQYEYHRTVVVNTLNGNRITRVNVFPSPVDGWANINIESNVNTTYLLEVFDNRGRLLFSENHNVTEGMNTLKMNMQNLSKGVYMLKASTLSQNFVYSKFIKK